MSRPDPNRIPVERPNKSQLKRDMEALQELGEALCHLPRERLAKVPMSERLRDAVAEYQRVGKHEAKRRHLQFIGKIMREEDPEPIREALDAFNGVSRAEIARQHKLERLRERLLESEEALGEIAAEFPEADLQHLRNLRRNAIKERDVQKPPRAFREIFQVLRQLAGTQDAASDEMSEESEKE